MRSAKNRTNGVHRICGPPGQGMVMGCGFLVKADGVDADRDRRDHSSVVLCLRGAATYRDHHGKTWNITPGMGFIRYAGLPHSLRIHAQGNWYECWVALGAPLDGPLMQIGAIDQRRSVITCGINPEIIAETRQLRDALREAADHDLPGMVGQIVQLFSRMTHVQAAQRAEPSPIEDACQRLAHNPRLELRQLAHDLGFSYERFRKIFRDEAGMSPGAWRLRRRIDRARELLLADHATVQGVAQELGYPNPFAFSAQFRLITGISPSQFQIRVHGR